MIDELRDHLVAADYQVDAVLDRLGPAGQAGLQRNSTIPPTTSSPAIGVRWPP